MTLAAIGATAAFWTVLAWLHGRRLIRVSHAIMDVPKRHMPRWAAATLTTVLAIVLIIPGPQDELLAMLIIGIVAAFMPEMRADMVRSVKFAWQSA